MPENRSLPTRVLLICAAIAVVTGIVSGIAGLLSVPVIATMPIMYGVLLTAHSLPGILAQVLLQRPWVAIIAHTIAAVVGFAMMPPLLGSFVSAIFIMGGIQEAWAALGRYKRWDATWLALGAAVLGVVLGLTAGLIIGIKHTPGIGAVFSVLITIAASVGWTLLSVAIGKSLRKAGLMRTSR